MGVVMFEIVQEFEDTAFTCLLYGSAGIGKTSFATWAPRPLVFNLESGLKGIDLKQREAFATTPITDWSTFIDGLEGFASQNNYTTAIVDTVSKLEDMMVSHVCSEGKKDSLADFPFGKGYDGFSALGSTLCEAMDLCKAKGKNVILIAHERIESFQDPENDAYDRFNCSLRKQISAKIKANVDHLFYMHAEKSKRELASGKAAMRMHGRILIQTKETGGIVAKTRGNRPLFIEVKNDETAREIWESL